MRFFLETLLKSIPLLLPLIGVIYAKQYVIIITVAYVTIFFIVEWLLVYKPSKRFEDRRRSILDAYFRPWVDKSEVDGRRPTIRISVMIVKKWFAGEYLFPLYSYNMKGYPDADLHFSAKVGVSGWCLQKRYQEPHFEELRNITAEKAKERFLFNEKLYERTKHIKAIVCMPLVRTHKRWLGYGEKQDFFGVLNVDAVDDFGVNFLQNDETLEDIYSFGIFIQRVFE